MRALRNTEIYSLTTKKTEQVITDVIQNKLNMSIGIISPAMIEPEIGALMLSSKDRPLLAQAIALYKSFNGPIRLFDLGLSSKGQAPIPAAMPFIPAKLRCRENENSPATQDTMVPGVLMNLYRIGNWSADGTQYRNLSLTDLRTVLESGFISYKMLVLVNTDKVLSDTTVIDCLTRIYANLFSSAIIRTMNPYNDDFSSDAAIFIIAEFFLRYCLEMDNAERIADYAYNTIAHKATSIKAIQEFERELPTQINYNSLSGFLETFGIAFFNSPILLANFEYNYLKMYGDGVAYAIEYVPYFLHFLFSIPNGAVLGGSVRWAKKLVPMGRDINKLYIAVTNILR
jgi:hypothetical protein